MKAYDTSFLMDAKTWNKKKSKNPNFDQKNIFVVLKICSNFHKILNISGKIKPISQIFYNK